MRLSIRNEVNEVTAGIAYADGVTVAPSPSELVGQLEELITRRQADPLRPERKDAVRAMLRAGGFKPSGRNKPASEYLEQAAREGRFPFINNLVDVNNYISLLSGLPISLLDAAEFGGSLILRLGREGERYVFNSAGQEIDLKGLVCACREAGDAPLGNPVKDSMQGKIKEHTQAVVGVIYAPTGAIPRAELEELVGRFGEMLRAHATLVETAIVTSGQ